MDVESPDQKRVIGNPHLMLKNENDVDLSITLGQVTPCQRKAVAQERYANSRQSGLVRNVEPRRPNGITRMTTLQITNPRTLRSCAANVT